ncbi:FadR/GntR family transcriptional regulator [Aeromicrobium sp. CF3.5]|uniref:FadR/GntR family transcriptional regulator n=1 Tax=Aeromicrobium sp. CF3.5 TaxID=3373078 RepID=UPI003EE70ACF
MSPTTLSLSERIADGIVDIIRTDGLRPGDPLMSSRELAKRFEVTTPTLREALRRLEATDVIRFRHGSGTYVGDGAIRRMMHNPHAGGVDRASMLELIEARLVLEPPIAARAAEHRGEVHLGDLEAATANALVPQRGEERPALHFHVALAAAAGNALVRETVEALLHVRSSDQVAIRRSLADRDRDHTEHLEILEAVRDRDAASAQTLTRLHLEAIHDSVDRLVFTQETS